MTGRTPAWPSASPGDPLTGRRGLSHSHLFRQKTQALNFTLQTELNGKQYTKRCVDLYIKYDIYIHTYSNPTTFHSFVHCNRYRADCHVKTVACTCQVGLLFRVFGSTLHVHWLGQCSQCGIHGHCCMLKLTAGVVTW